MCRWFAPEALCFQYQSQKSDVWSFSCLVWECCTLGATLYSNINSTDLIAHIKSGTRPERINYAHDDLYQLLLNCWQLEPNERPSFSGTNFSKDKKQNNNILKLQHKSVMKIILFFRHYINVLAIPFIATTYTIVQATRRCSTA